MSFRIAVVAVVIVAALALCPSASQPTVELRVLTARAIATVLAEVGSKFERTSGYKLTIVSDLPSGIARHLASGKPADLVVSGSSSIDDWIKQGRVLADTRTEIARSAIGVEVRAGGRKPDVSSVDAFKRALLDAKSIAYLKVGSGIHIDKVVQQLGIADAIRAKVTRPDTDIVSQLVARGDVELGIVVITQIMTTPGVVLAGPLPAELQSHVTFTAGVAANSTSKAAARGLIEFLGSPTATVVMKKQGMEPVSSGGAKPSESRVPIDSRRSLYARAIGQERPVIVLHGGPNFDHGYLLRDLDWFCGHFVYLECASQLRAALNRFFARRPHR